MRHHEILQRQGQEPCMDGCMLALVGLGSSSGGWPWALWAMNLAVVRLTSGC